MKEGGGLVVVKCSVYEVKKSKDGYCCHYCAGFQKPKICSSLPICARGIYFKKLTEREVKKKKHKFLKQ